MSDPELAGWDVWTLIAVLTEQRHHAHWDSRVEVVRARLEGGADPNAGRFAPLRLAAWAARKACETHVIMNVLTVLALGQLMLADTSLLAGRIYLLTMAPIAAAMTAFSIVRSQWSQSAEREFAAWYRVPPDCELTFSDGWWLVEPREGAEGPESGRSGKCAQSQGGPPEQSS